MAAILTHAEMNYVGGEAAQPVRVAIRNGREEAPGSWTDCGFELHQHASAVTDWDDKAQIERIHYEEIAELAKRLTGCDIALVGGHIRRNPEQAAVHGDLSPITFVHSDFAPSYLDVVRKRYEQPSEDTKRSLERAGIDADDVARARRIEIVQFWRNTGEPRMDFPIAFCDARTVGPDELKVIDVTDYAGGGIDFQALGINAPADPARHEWYAFPDMAPDEVVVFRTFDSDRVETDQPFWTPHSAFRDADVPPGQPARRSIELRATCLYF